MAADLNSIAISLGENIFRPYRDGIILSMVAPNVKGFKTGLDYGCGDGKLAKRLEEVTGCKFIGLDPVKRKEVSIPTIQSTKSIPDNHFDLVIIIDVLHHTEDYAPILKEAVRVSKSRVIIKDHHYETLLDHANLCAADYWGNNPYGVSLPYNFKTMDEWKALLGNIYNIAVTNITTFEMGLVDICKHVIIVLEKKQGIGE